MCSSVSWKRSRPRCRSLGVPTLPGPGPVLWRARSLGPLRPERAPASDDQNCERAVLLLDGSSAALCQSGQRGCCSLMLFSTCWLGSWREVRRRDCRPTRSDARHAALLVAGTTTLTSLGCGASTRWLNESVGGAASFFLVIVEAIWIGKSPPAPPFYVDHGPECRNPSGRRPEAGACERHSGGLSGPPFLSARVAADTLTQWSRLEPTAD
jgi:hypothetical protein